MSDDNNFREGGKIHKKCRHRVKNHSLNQIKTVTLFNDV